MIPPDILNDGLALAEMVAPAELAEAPLYLLDMADTARRAAGICYAYTSTASHTDSALRDVLVERGEWRGPGRIVVFDMEGIKQDCDNLRRAVLQVLLHELAHCLPVPVQTKDREPSTISRLADILAHKQFVAAPVQPTIAGDHGGPFVRRCVHVWHRALWAGFHANIWSICAGGRYGLAHAYDYIEALADEPLRLRGETFASIEEIEPPAAFSRLWDSDKQKLLESQQ
jgi:hypothetical protein